MSDEMTLLPCPFCKGEAEICHVRDICRDPQDWYWGKCLSCHISGKHYPTEAEAIAAWNTRAYLNPDGLPIGLTISDDGNLLNWRGENYVKQGTLGNGTLTAEQVRETVEKHGVNDGCVYSIFKGSFKAIADELNAKLGSGTCENLSSMNVDGVAGYHFICSECGLSVCASMGIGEIEPSGSRSFRWKVDGRYEFERCPRCAKKVKR